MKVLKLDTLEGSSAVPDSLTAVHDDLTVICGEDSLVVPKDPAEVDAVIGRGDCSPGAALINMMLGWRTHPHTYLIPCWFPIEKKALDRNCLWPRLAIDRFDGECDAANLDTWLRDITEWQQSRMQFTNNGTIEERSALELAASLSLRRASGVLSVFDDEGAGGRFLFCDGNLVSGNLKHLRSAEAFYEFLCMAGGGYEWENSLKLTGDGDPRPLSQVIPEALRLIHGANLLYHFAPDFDSAIEKTDSESALDDSASAYYEEQREIYGLVKENISISQILEASPLSRPRTMVLLAKWFSLNDIASTRTPREVPEPKCRVLIVDDSPLMCRALEGIFSGDPRLEPAGVAHDGMEALRLIGETNPDVVTLDLQMPKMDGLSTLKHILIREPKPVVVLSAFTKETSRQTYESFKFGAVDVLTKPANGAAVHSEAFQVQELCDRVFDASQVHLHAVKYIRRKKLSGADVTKPPAKTSTANAENLLLVLCGEGGFPSLIKLVFAVRDPEHIPPTVVGTAMPARVVEALVFNLQKDTQIPMEVVSGPRTLEPGVLYFLPNEKSWGFLREAERIRIEGGNAPHGKDRFFDALLASAAESLGPHAVAVLLSGTGQDGLEGLRQCLQAGGRGFALCPYACLRPDLPQKAIEQGYATELKTISDLAELFDGVPWPNQNMTQKQTTEQPALDGNWKEHPTWD